MYERAVELERAHRYGDALQAFVACGAWDEIVALLDQRGSELLEQGHIDTIASAINSVLAKNESIPPRLATLLGTIEARRGRTDISDAWFREAAATVAPGVEAAEIAYRHGCALTSRFNGAACVELLAPIANQANLPAELRASIFAVLAVANVFLKQFDDAKSAIAQSLHTLDAHAPPIVQAQVYQHAAWVHLFIGDIRAARLLAPEAAQLAIQNGLQEIAASAYSILYNIAVDVDDNPPEGVRLLGNIRECGARTRNSRFELYAVTGLYDLAAESGDFERVKQLHGELREHEVTYGHDFASDSFLPAEALKLAANGEFSAAYQLLAPSAPRQTLMDDRFALRLAEIAIYAAAAGLKKEAREAEDSARATLDGISEKSLRTQRAQVYLALVAMLSGNEVATQSMLHSLRAEISPHARVRALLDSITVLWQYWKGSDNHDEFFRSLERLRERQLGGLASVIEALPHPTLVV